MASESRERAYEFLRRLEEELKSKLPPPDEMSPWIRHTVAAAKLDESQKHLRNSEAAFLNVRVIPVVSRLLQDEPWCLTPNESKKALLNEYYSCMPNYSTQSPKRLRRHPFEKLIGASADSVYARWTNTTGHVHFKQPCPDFAVSSAKLPFATVFEGKYFSRGSLRVAQRQLVSDIYQAFFYRSLPELPEGKNHAAWRYEFACLLAYDASKDGVLREAWCHLSKDVRKGFWEDANLYVMVLGGSR